MKEILKNVGKAGIGIFAFAMGGKLLDIAIKESKGLLNSNRN